jgi:cellulose biosynthesis protein BcsQ
MTKLFSDSDIFNSGSANFPGAFHQLLTRTMEEYDFEYVIIDLSPSANTVNKLLIMRFVNNLSQKLN